MLAHRLVYVVLLYGAAWADILVRLARRFQQLGIVHPLVAISIGAEAADVCQRLAASSDFLPSRVLCWSPDSQSQVHRFTSIHALLHMGS